MDVRLSRAKSPIGKGDPHDWNTYDHYRTIYEKYLDEHPFVDPERINRLQFMEKRGEVLLRGQVYCQRNIVLAVDQALEVRYAGNLMRVRPHFYHHRVYDPRTGEEILYERLHRHQFPTLGEVLDELEIVAGMLDE